MLLSRAGTHDLRRGSAGQTRPNPDVEPALRAGSGTGSAGGRIWPSGNGEPSARITRTMAPVGSISRTSRHEAGSIVGARTACSASRTAGAACVSRWQCGTATTRSSRSVCSCPTHHNAARAGPNASRRAQPTIRAPALVPHHRGCSAGRTRIPEGEARNAGPPHGVSKRRFRGGVLWFSLAEREPLRVDPSVLCASKITRARKEKRPGTGGRSRNPESEARQRVLPQESAYGPSSRGGAAHPALLSPVCPPGHGMALDAEVPPSVSGPAGENRVGPAPASCSDRCVADRGTCRTRCQPASGSC